MTAKKFVELCFAEKESTLKEYFDENTPTEVGERLRSLISDGTDKDALYEAVSLILNETYYSILLALDGDASLGGIQMSYKIFDEDQNLLNECGEIESAAFEYFMEE